MHWPLSFILSLHTRYFYLTACWYLIALVCTIQSKLTKSKCKFPFLVDTSILYFTIHSPVKWWKYSSIHHSFIHSIITPLSCRHNCLRLYNCLIHSFIHSFIHSLIHSSIHPSIHACPVCPHPCTPPSTPRAPQCRPTSPTTRPSWSCTWLRTGRCTSTVRRTASRRRRSSGCATASPSSSRTATSACSPTDTSWSCATWSSPTRRATRVALATWPASRRSRSSSRCKVGAGVAAAWPHGRVVVGAVCGVIIDYLPSQFFPSVPVIPSSWRSPLPCVQCLLCAYPSSWCPSFPCVQCLRCACPSSWRSLLPCFQCPRCACPSSWCPSLPCFQCPRCACPSSCSLPCFQCPRCACPSSWRSPLPCLQCPRCACPSFWRSPLPPMLPVPPLIPGGGKITRLSVVVHQSIRLECRPSGDPKPNITWFKDGSIIDPKGSRHVRVLQGGRVLQLPSATPSDAGGYTCHAMNIAGEDQRRYNLQVHGELPSYC